MRNPRIIFIGTASGSDTNVSATTDSFTLTEYSATVANDVNVAASTDTFTVSTYAVSLGTDVNVSASVDTFTLTEYSATVANDVNVAASTDTFTVTENAATVGYAVNVSTTTDALTLTEYSASIAKATNVTTNVDALTLTEYLASVSVSTTVQESTGGWDFYEAWQPTKEEIKKERIRLGIIKPESDQIIRTIKKVAKSQIRPEEAKKEARSYFAKQDLQFAPKHEEIIDNVLDFLRQNTQFNPVEYTAQKSSEAAREAQAQREHEELILLLQAQRDAIEEQDMIFVITCLAA